MADTESVSAAVRSWRQELVELGGPNTLLWASDDGPGLDLTSAHPGGTARLFSTRSARLSELVRESYAFAEASRRLRRVQAVAEELAEERGLATAHLTVGVARWDATDQQGRPAYAPVLLRRVGLGPITGSPDDMLITLGEDVLVNPVLLTYLRLEGAGDLDVQSLTALAQAGSWSEPRQVFEEIARASAGLPGFRIERRRELGNVNLAKSAMVADLMGDIGGLTAHPMIGAIAGDREAADLVAAVPPPYDAAAVVRHDGVLPADAAQDEVVHAVLAGAQLTVDAPPGTGKTQTIANLVAALAAQGRPALLVAQKQAAIGAVQHRLDAVGLGDLVIHLRDGEPSHELADLFNRRIQEALATEGAAGTARPAVDHLTTRLEDHHAGLHAPHAPWGVSVREALDRITELGRLRPAPRSHVRLGSDDLLALSANQRAQAGGRLVEVARRGAWPTSGENDPWFGADIVGPTQAARALDLVTELADRRLAEHRSLIDGLFDQVGLPAPETMRDEERSLDLMQHIAATLEVFRPEVFEAPLSDLAAATGNREYRRESTTELGMMDRRRLSNQAQSLLRPGPRPELHGVLVRAKKQRDQWREIAGKGSRPAIGNNLSRAVAAHERLREDLEWLSARLESTRDHADLLDLPFEAVAARLSRLARSRDRLEIIPEIAGSLDALQAQGLGPLVDDLAHRQVPADHVANEFEFVWWTSLLAHLDRGADEPVGLDIRRIIDEAADVDDADREALARAVREGVDARLRAVVRGLPDQVRDVRQGLAFGASLSELLPVAPELLMALAPCWAVSPYLVPSVIPRGGWFDVTMIDEASQLSTAAAVPAISRAAQLVLFGDRHELAPVRFDLATGTSSSQIDVSGEVPSVLDEVRPMVPSLGLNTHYRAHDARLFAFAGSNIYADRLGAFPSATTDRVVRLDVAASDGSVAGEIDHVCDLVVRHGLDSPDESLMVITLTTEHAERIRAALNRRAVTDPQLALLLHAPRREPVRILPVDRAQGYTRDAVIFACGVRVDSAGALVGAAAERLVRGGERRMAVATTRAGHRMTVVSSFHPADVAIAALRSRGAELLRDLLIHASEGGSRRDVGSPEPGSHAGRRRRTASTGSVLSRPVPVVAEAAQQPPVVADLADRLRAEGLVVHAGPTVARPVVDLIVEDPNRPGSPAVAIDVDSSAVACVPSVYDRDVVRPRQIRERGLHYERVCARDVFRDPAREVARLTGVIEKAAAVAATERD
ncbi:DUF4011 domain-containing protein [Calidifontibacter terrae]